ncbi:PCRF domain-containing protein, partial [candidate division WOR-3 bacterium]|nr:PCRF domain-containing protein [candidate division WOR-3 bacterium]
MPTTGETFRRRFEPLLRRLPELESELSDPKVASDVGRLREVTREYRQARATLARLDQYAQVEREAADAAEVARTADEPELKELAEKELAALEESRDRLAAELEAALRPRSPDWDKGCIVEIRAAAGGQESALFAGELFRMYSRFAEEHNLKVEVMDSRPSELKGYKEVILAVEGDEPFRFFRFESGVHRVQRVPETEASGRIHTSTVTVAVLPEPEEVELRVNPEEVRVDVFRAGGHGGQGVNKTESAV